MDDQCDSVSGLEAKAGLNAGSVMESKPTSGAPAESQSGTPSAYRLVIRVKLIPEGPQTAPVRQRLNRGLLLLALAAVVLLSWVGISMFRDDPISSMPAPKPSEAAPMVKDEALQKSPIQTNETKSVELAAEPTEAVIKEVIPDVPRSARDTIRGTIRVSVRVIVGKEGTVLLASADDPGPSRYFERLAVEASKKWMFAPLSLEAQRIMVLRFNFTRTETTARANFEH